MAKKTAAKAAAAKKAGPLPAIVVPPAAPAGAAPIAPANFQPLEGTQIKRMLKPMGVQTSSAGAVATEILASKTWVADFGNKTETAALLAAAFQSSADWLKEHADAATWAAYTADASTIVTNALLVLLNTNFVKDFETALHHDASIATRYPNLTAYLGARSAAAQRAADTRRENEKKAAAATPATPAATPAAPATPAK